jgi:predicted transcriptional regulator
VPKTLTLRIDDETHRSFMKRAKSENRSLANFIETAVRQHIRESDFVDDSEMAEILANEQLVERLRKGSKDARKKKGTMIG